MKDLAEFLAYWKSEKKRLGLKDSGIMGSMEQMDLSSGTVRYDVVMIPRKPKPRDKITYTKQEDTL